MADLKKCRICDVRDIDKKTMIENVDWMMPSKNYYYHVKCYNTWQANKQNIKLKMSDAKWFDYLKEFLAKDLKMSVDYSKLTSQWNNFIKKVPDGGTKPMTAKGIYYSILYYYEIKKNSTDKSEGGIGIVPYIYVKSSEYWLDRENKEKGICAKILEQIRQREAQEIVTIHNVKISKTKKQIDWAAIESMEDPC